MPDDSQRDSSIDVNGCPTEVIVRDGQEIVVHYDDLPECDVTTIDGIPVTTALRTVIDIAPAVSGAELDRIVSDCLRRGLFTVPAAWERITRADLVARPGARLLGQRLPQW